MKLWLAALLLLVAACSASPTYCDDYQAWARAANDVAEIELRNWRLDEWPPGEMALWEAALDRQWRYAERIWDTAPDDATWLSVEQECG